MNEEKLKKALKSVDDARMEKLNIDELTDVELKSLDEILSPEPKCEKKKWQCIDFRRWLAVAAAIVLLLVFIPRENANAGFIKAVVTEKPGHIEYVVIENKEQPEEEKDFIVDYIIPGFELKEKIVFRNRVEYIFKNSENRYYNVSRSLLNIGQSGMYSTTGRDYTDLEIDNTKISIISKDNSSTIFWFSEYYLYDIVGLIPANDALKLAEDIIELNK